VRGDATALPRPTSCGWNRCSPRWSWSAGATGRCSGPALPALRRRSPWRRRHCRWARRRRWGGGGEARAGGPWGGAAGGGVLDEGASGEGVSGAEESGAGESGDGDI